MNMKQQSKKIYHKVIAGFFILKKRDIHHPMFIPLVSGIILFFLAIAIFIYFSGTTVVPSSSRVVQIYNYGKEEIIPTTATTVGDLIKRLGITINPGDIIDPSEDTPILTNGFKINIYRVHPVTIIENGQSKVLLTADVDPRVIAEEAGYTIYPQDYVTDVSSPTELTKNIIGQVISIVPATQVNLTLYGTQVSLRTHAKTVAELLSQDKIKTTTGANVLPALSTPISSGMQVLVVPIGQQLISEQQPIAFGTQYVNNPDLPYDTTKITQVGVAGSELVVEQVVIKNGITTNTPIQTVIVNEPIEQIVDRGTGITSINGGDNITWLRSSDIDSSDYTYVNYIITNESHWNPDDINAEGCIGLGQFCNPLKLTIPCPDWQIDAVCQLNTFNAYAVSRYGSWANAAAFWAAHKWW
jgi:uncharacterized protein YabE (DUF348 family)